jgi:HK97 family phage prohead protease
VSSIDSILFTKSVTFDPIKVNGRRIVAGYANVADVVDSQNEKITMDALTRAWVKFSSNPKFCVNQLFHTNVPIASILLDPIVDADGITHKSGMDSRGLYIVSELRDDIKIANDVWNSIQLGKISGFSIGGEYLSPPVTECFAGKCHSVVNDIELHEVSIVDSPANKVSLFNILKNDSLSKLGELTSNLKDRILNEGVVQVSKNPYSDGKYGVWMSIPIELSVPDGFKVVKEKCPQNEWISLFDLALLRPYSVKEEVITGSIPGGSKDASLLDKPNSVEESALTDEVKQEIVNPDVKQSEVVTPTVAPVEERKPLTLEILAADIARIVESQFNMLNLLSLKADKPKEKVEDEESDEDKKKKLEEEKAKEKPVEKMAKSEATPPPATPIPPVEVKIEAPKVEIKVEAPPPVKVEEVKVPERVPIPEPTESKVIVRGLATPKPEYDVGKVDLLKLHKTPWKKLAGDE